MQLRLLKIACIPNCCILYSMKRLLLSIILLFVLLQSSAQNQGNIWYFGGNYLDQQVRGAGLDFNSGMPVPLTNSGMGYTEGCASYCNTSGALLFYAKGDSIYDNTHSLMSNGAGLGGNWSTGQSTLIVPVTNDSNTYYVFSNSGEPTSPGTGLHYSIVDMSLNGGLGQVTLKAIPLLSNTGEQLTGTKHSNGIDFWVITTDYDSTIFYSYRISAMGVSASVISDLGYNSFAHFNLDMSPNGNKIAMKVGPSATLGRVLFDFDNSSGVVSNPYPLLQDQENCGSTFSPDGNLFYDIENLPAVDKIIQYDLNAPNILASKTVIATSTNDFRMDMKIGPDGKIYISKKYNFLDVIHNPNVIGAGCNYEVEGVNLASKLSGTQLPNILLIADHILGINALTTAQKQLIRIVDTMGRETKDRTNTLLIYVYSDGTTEKVFRAE
jgi:hypothetical protein